MTLGGGPANFFNRATVRSNSGLGVDDRLVAEEEEEEEAVECNRLVGICVRVRLRQAAKETSCTIALPRIGRVNGKPLTLKDRVAKDNAVATTTMRMGALLGSTIVP
jgi:hypothetical protein